MRFYPYLNMSYTSIVSTVNTAREVSREGKKDRGRGRGRGQ
jgi:hypothetical protein